MTESTRKALLFGVPIAVIGFIALGVIEAELLTGLDRVLYLLSTAAFVGCGVSGWLYAFDRSRFSTALGFTGAFAFLIGMAMLAEDIRRGDFFSSLDQHFWVSVMWITTGFCVAQKDINRHRRKPPHVP